MKSSNRKNMLYALEDSFIDIKDRISHPYAQFTILMNENPSSRPKTTGLIRKTIQRTIQRKTRRRKSKRTRRR
jgi:hypothetical protein